ncbi:MAG: hypothetical protein ACOC8N_07185 [Spirochaetota bacterium]
MTKSEFQKKVMDLLKRYQLFGRMKERILPLFTIADHLDQEDMLKIYSLLEKAAVARHEAERLSEQLGALLRNLADSLPDTPRGRAGGGSGQEKGSQATGGPSSGATLPEGLPAPAEKPPAGRRQSGRNRNRNGENNTIQSGNAMQYNKHPFPGGKPNFGLKLNKLFSAFITEYGPQHVTLVISDSILYTNNLILRISLHKREVLIGSSRSLKLYETEEGNSFLVTDKPEVIPFGTTRGFFYKNITYEDILNLTNGDFYKVFGSEILDTYKPFQASLPEELKKVGYYRFE